MLDEAAAGERHCALAPAMMGIFASRQPWMPSGMRQTLRNPKEMACAAA
jgi:hypothetical protein